MGGGNEGRDRGILAGGVRGLADHNRRRTQEAAPVQVVRVRAALAVLGDQAPPLYAQAGRLRLARPADSLTELAAHASVTKHTLAGRLRRLVALAEMAADGR
jgi:DNA-binding transcriptional regulator WhiA